MATGHKEALYVAHDVKITISNNISIELQPALLKKPSQLEHHHESRVLDSPSLNEPIYPNTITQKLLVNPSSGPHRQRSEAIRCNTLPTTHVQNSDSNNSPVVPYTPPTPKQEHKGNATPSLSPDQLSKEETLIIFDWDDTLLPTTHIQRCLLYSGDDNGNECPISALTEQLEILSKMVKNTLDSASRLGHVVIITNAEKEWVQQSCKRFMPSLASTVNNIQVISARSTYKNLMKNMASRWKKVAFERVVRSFYDDRPGRKNILSFGDSPYERDAVLSVWEDLHSHSNTVLKKSIKLIERPTVSELITEHDRLGRCMSMLALHVDDVDICIMNEANKRNLSVYHHDNAYIWNKKNNIKGKILHNDERLNIQPTATN